VYKCFGSTSLLDTFAALALATEAPKDDIIKGKPYPEE